MGSPSIALAVLLGAGLANAAPPAPEFECKLKKAGDAVQVQVEGQRAVFAVTSATGIGELSVRLKSGSWPRQVVLRLLRADGGEFSTLEGFRLTTERLQVRSSLGESNRMSFFLPDAEGKFDPKSPQAGTLQVIAGPQGKAMEVTPPANVCVGSREVSFGWIDAYR
jgi:hypothetical protein